MESGCGQEGTGPLENLKHNELCGAGDPQQDASKSEILSAEETSGGLVWSAMPHPSGMAAHRAAGHHCGQNACAKMQLRDQPEIQAEGHTWENGWFGFQASGE